MWLVLEVADSEFHSEVNMGWNERKSERIPRTKKCEAYGKMKEELSRQERYCKKGRNDLQASLSNDISRTAVLTSGTKKKKMPLAISSSFGSAIEDTAPSEELCSTAFRDF